MFSHSRTPYKSYLLHFQITKLTGKNFNLCEYIYIFMVATISIDHTFTSILHSVMSMTIFIDRIFISNHVHTLVDTSSLSLNFPLAHLVHQCVKHEHDYQCHFQLHTTIQLSYSVRLLPPSCIYCSIQNKSYSNCPKSANYDTNGSPSCLSHNFSFCCTDRHCAKLDVQLDRNKGNE